MARFQETLNNLQKNHNKIRECRTALNSLLEDDRSFFEDVFLQERVVPLSRKPKGDEIALLLDLGLLHKKLGGVTSSVRIHHFHGRFVATDFPDRPFRNQVFPLHPECDYIVRHMEVNPGDKVLDLGTGSGVQALFATQTTGRTFATDINPRALRFACFNAVLNGEEEKIQFSQGSFFRPVRGNKFDLVLVNYPFEPVPPGARYFYHSDGGPDGQIWFRRFLHRFLPYVQKDWRVRMVSFSLGRGSHLLVEDLLRETLQRYPVKASIDLLASPMPFHLFAKRFSRLPGYSEWLHDLQIKGYAEMHYLSLLLRPDSRFCMEKTCSLSEEGVRWDVPLDWNEPMVAANKHSARSASVNV